MAGSLYLEELHRDEDALLLANAVNEFGNRELAPYLKQLGREDFAAQFIPLAGQHGFLGIAIPSQYGGQGGTLESFLSVIESIAACDGSLALTLAAHESLATGHVLLGANDEQKRKYLPQLTSGKKIGAWGLTEPQAGSNIFNDMRTKLVRRDGGWSLSGEKTFITNGCHADVFVVLARAFAEDGKDEGITACIVEKMGNESRIIATPLHAKMGMARSDTAALRFDDVPVADGAILLPIGSAGKIARRVLLRGRVGIGALALGLARDSMERAIRYSKERQVAGGSLFEQALSQAKFFRMEMNLSVAWQAVVAAAQLADRSLPFKIQASMAKVFATDVALRICDEAIQILGGYGYMGDYKVEQNYRDARLLTIGEGATEILQLAITGNLLEESRAGKEDVLPPLERLASAAGQTAESMNKLWGPAWRLLQLSADSVLRVQEKFAQNEAVANRQPKFVAFADLATKLWVAMQAMRTGTAPAEEGGASQKQMDRVKAFVAASSIQICHQAAVLIGALGAADPQIYNNYLEALKLGVSANC